MGVQAWPLATVTAWSSLHSGELYALAFCWREIPFVLYGDLRLLCRLCPIFDEYITHCIANPFDYYSTPYPFRTMRSRSFSVVSLFATLAAAQNAFIRAPPPQTTLSPGQSFTVEVDRPVG